MNPDIAHDAFLMPASLQNCLAPAKLNLFLHVTGRRADGYHLLQTAFQLIDHGDTLHFTVRDDARIERTTELAGVPADSDLVVRAARLLQAAAASKYPGRRHGADIAVEKRLPMGGGLGGGSSDAATTLMALNHLWQTGLTRAELMALGLQLGADVPFFIFGHNAFAEGIGEEMQAVETPNGWFVVHRTWGQRADGNNIFLAGIDKGHETRQNNGLFRSCEFEEIRIREKRPANRGKQVVPAHCRGREMAQTIWRCENDRFRRLCILPFRAGKPGR